MLGNCILRNPRTSDNKFDKGLLCEALLFFDRTHLVIDHPTLYQVVQANFLDDLIELLNAGYLTANYAGQLTGLHTDTKLGLSEHRFIIFKISGDQSTGQMLRNQDLLEYNLNRALNDRPKAKRYHRELRSLLSFQDIGDDSLADVSLGDIQDWNFARDIIGLSLQNKGIPPEEIIFTKCNIISLSEKNFVIDTDIDFDRLRQFVPKDERATFNSKDLFPGVIDARLNIYLAAQHNAALLGNGTDQAVADLIVRKCMGTKLDHRLVSEAIYDFISVDTPSVREVINSGVRSTREFVKLLSSASAFKQWLSVQNPDKSLIDQMLREKSKAGWLASLPGKSTRFALFTGGGVIADLVATGGLGTAVGVGASAIDSFLVDRLINRWKPHYFIEKHLKGFLDVTQA